MKANKSTVATSTVATSTVAKRTLPGTTDRIVMNNMESYLAIATPAQICAGMIWYHEAQEFCQLLSIETGVDTYTVAAIVSALSPNNKWERNKKDAETLIKAFLAGAPMDSIKVCTYNPNKVKAWGIMAGTVEIAAKSPKTHSFAMNIGRLSESHVTIDKWHLRACLTKPKDGIVPTVESATPAQYRRIEALTARLAKKHGLKAYELQAIIWVTIKDAWGR